MPQSNTIPDRKCPTESMPRPRYSEPLCVRPFPVCRWRNHSTWTRRQEQQFAIFRSYLPPAVNTISNVFFPFLIVVVTPDVSASQYFDGKEMNFGPALPLP